MTAYAKGLQSYDMKRQTRQQIERCIGMVSRRFKRRESGQGMVEYALILVLVSIVVIVILLTMGNQIANVFSNVVAALG